MQKNKQADKMFDQFSSLKLLLAATWKTPDNLIIADGLTAGGWVQVYLLVPPKVTPPPPASEVSGGGRYATAEVPP